MREEKDLQCLNEIRGKNICRSHDAFITLPSPGNVRNNLSMVGMLAIPWIIIKVTNTDKYVAAWNFFSSVIISP